jgi:two-component system, chemotaxis family, protein-glutamate methylesterase/glutaminase
MSSDFGNGDRIRVLIVDDSAFMRTALARMIASEPGMEVAGTACDACDAFQKISSLDPDVITLDISMPGLDGIGMLRRIMDEFPRPVIMVSAATETDAEATKTALSAGAFDIVAKQLSSSSLEITHIRADLVTKVRSAAHSSSSAKKHAQSVTMSANPADIVAPAVVAIGLSTGGPRALEQILPRFPADFPVPILIVQHMPVGFTQSLAQRLDSLSRIKVCEASHRELIHRGVAYIARAGFHMHVVPRLSDSKPMITLDHRPTDAEHVPSIDVLMNDVAQVFKNRAVGVIMTGMGSDGAEGMAAIFHQGGLTLGQDQASCAVYGMPRACAERGVLTRVVSLADIPTRIVQAVARRRKPA